MPPKDGLDLLDGILYFAEEENGEYKPIGKFCEFNLSEVEITEGIDAEELYTDTDLEDIIPEEYRLPTAHEFSFSLESVPQHCLKLFKLIKVNNYRRLHGLKPIRCKVWRHKPELSTFALNRTRRGCYKKW